MQKGTENDEKKLDLNAEYGKIDSVVKNYIATVTQPPRGGGGHTIL